MLDFICQKVLENKFHFLLESTCRLQGHAACDKESKKRILNAEWGMDISAEDKDYVYNFLRFMIMNGRDLEIMITNYEFEVPDFWNIFEHIINDYKKTNYATLSKLNSAKGLIPKDGMFCKMPVKLLADMIYHELYSFRYAVEDWEI